MKIGYLQDALYVLTSSYVILCKTQSETLQTLQNFYLEHAFKKHYVQKKSHKEETYFYLQKATYLF